MVIVYLIFSIRNGSYLNIQYSFSMSVYLPRYAVYFVMCYHFYILSHLSCFSQTLPKCLIPVWQRFSSLCLSRDLIPHLPSNKGFHTIIQVSCVSKYIFSYHTKELLLQILLLTTLVYSLYINLRRIVSIRSLSCYSCQPVSFPLQKYYKKHKHKRITVTGYGGGVNENEPVQLPKDKVEKYTRQTRKFL